MTTIMSSSQRFIANAAANRHVELDGAAAAASPSPNTKTRRRFAATKQALDDIRERVSKQDLEGLLDASIGHNQEEGKACLKVLKESLRNNLGRVTDLFHAIDKDRSGSIDASEFQAGVLSICGSECDHQSVQALFSELDGDADGQVTYKQLHRILNAKRPYKQELLATAEPLPEWPMLPSKLVKWRVEVLELYRIHCQLRKPSYGSQPGSRCHLRPFIFNEGASQGTLKREYAPPPELAHEKLLQHATGLSFAELLCLYFPRSTRVSAKDCEMMASWARQVQEVKAAHKNLRSLEKDAVMIEALDTDGSGTISKSEFLQLSKLMGLNPADCRLRFREADVAHAGELSISKTGAVLQQIRQEDAKRLLEQEDSSDRVSRSRPSTATEGAEIDGRFSAVSGGWQPLLHRQLGRHPSAGSKKGLLPAM